MNTEIAEYMRSLLAGVLGCKPELVQADAKLVEDLGCDSLGLFEIAFGLKERYGIELIPEGEEENGQAMLIVNQLSHGTVADLVAYVEQAISAVSTHE